MGQGQADIALQLLHDCGRNGEWLCLKNLHLVTAWLPVLEKVSNSSFVEYCSSIEIEQKRIQDIILLMRLLLIALTKMR